MQATSCCWSPHMDPENLLLLPFKRGSAGIRGRTAPALRSEVEGEEEIAEEEGTVGVMDA